MEAVSGVKEAVFGLDIGKHVCQIIIFGSSYLSISEPQLLLKTPINNHYNDNYT